MSAPTVDTWTPAWRLRELVARRELSAVEVTRHALERIASLDAQLHAFITVCEDVAENQAAVVDAMVRRGDDLGPLAGVPISIKDELCTRGVRTTAGSLIYRDHVPTADALLVERVRSAGAVLIGKTNMPEFAMQPRTWNRLDDECANPWDMTRISGGSSGGAAASVAAGMVPIAIGSDGGGSIRIPAALCGVCGLLPTIGQIAQDGSLSGGSPILSSDGPIARDVRDLAVLFAVLAGESPEDVVSEERRAAECVSSLENGVDGIRLRWVSSAGAWARTDDALVEIARRSALRFAECGAEVDDLDRTIDTEQWWQVLLTINSIDRYALVGERVYEDPVSRGLLTDYAMTAFAQASMLRAVQYPRALAARARAREMLSGVFGDADLIVTPTVGVVAPTSASGLDRPALVSFCFIANLCGFPAATIPCGFQQGLPVGLQIIGRPYQEALILRACRAFEGLQPWAGAVPGNVAAI